MFTKLKSDILMYMYNNNLPSLIALKHIENSYAAIILSTTHVIFVMFTRLCSLLCFVKNNEKFSRKG